MILAEELYEHPEETAEELKKLRDYFFYPNVVARAETVAARLGVPLKDALKVLGSVETNDDYLTTVRTWRDRNASRIAEIDEVLEGLSSEV